MAYEKLAEILVEAYKKTMEFADKFMSNLDDEKYARAINDLYGRSPSDEELDSAINQLKIELIKEDTTTSLEDKLAMLDAILEYRDSRRDKEIEQKKKYAEMIDDGNHKKADVAIKVACGVMTGGVSLIPDIVDATKGAVKTWGDANKDAEVFFPKDNPDGSDGLEE